MLSVQKTSLESQKIHESFKIALKASRMLKNNNTIFSNQTQTLKLRAPPKFCPFSFEISCDDLFLKYRQIDGSCNNPGNSLIGKTSTPFKRLLKASYEDGIEEPKRVGVDGELLPNPREIALKVHDPLDLPAKISHYGVLFGQFIDHDFAQSAATGSGFSPLNACATQIAKTASIFQHQMMTCLMTKSAWSSHVQELHLINLIAALGPENN